MPRIRRAIIIALKRKGNILVLVTSVVFVASTSTSPTKAHQAGLAIEITANCVEVAVSCDLITTRSRIPAALGSQESGILLWPTPVRIPQAFEPPTLVWDFDWVVIGLQLAACLFSWGVSPPGAS